MSKKVSLGFRTLFVGWCVAALMFLWPTPLASTTTVFLGLGLVLATAALLFREWVQRVRLAVAEAPGLSHGVMGQARNHGLALAATGIIVGTPLTALTLYLAPGLFASFGAAPAQQYGNAFLVLLAIAAGLSWLLAKGWAANCAPDWIES